MPRVPNPMPVPKLTVDVHPPKVERFDVDAMTNTDPKGFVRAVDEYRVESFGLYVARPMVGHPTMRYLESWLLPELNLRVTDFWFRAGHERDQDFYLDVATIDTDTDTDTGGAAKRCWRSVDHYIDLVLRTGRDLDVLDTDELLAALTAGLIDGQTATSAFDTAYTTIDGLARHGYRLEAWLSTVDIRLSWRRR